MQYFNAKLTELDKVLAIRHWVRQMTIIINWLSNNGIRTIEVIEELMRERGKKKGRRHYRI